MSLSIDPSRWAALTVDLGTGGPKIALVTLDGTIHWSEFRPIPTERPSAGRALQDADLWWTEILDAARGALAAGVKGEAGDAGEAGARALSAAAGLLLPAAALACSAACRAGGTLMPWVLR